MEMPCVGCKEEGLKQIPKRTLTQMAHKFFKITLANDKEVIVCSEHLEKTNLFKIKKIENSNLVFKG